MVISDADDLEKSRVSAFIVKEFSIICYICHQTSQRASTNHLNSYVLQSNCQLSTVNCYNSIYLGSCRVRRCGKLPTKAQIFEGDAPYILNAFCCRKSDSDSVDENSCRYQNSDFAFAGGNLSLAIASKCCRRNPNRSID
jgi:hypothetical protein